MVQPYLESCVDQLEEYVKTQGVQSTSWGRAWTVNLPSREGFAKYIKVPLRTMKGWYIHEEFSHALEEIDAEQKIRLMHGGLSDTYNPTIAKLILSSNHGMKERYDGTTDDKPLQKENITVQIVNATQEEEN